MNIFTRCNGSSNKFVFTNLLIASLIISCSSDDQVLKHPTTSATLWTQNSAEYQALTTMIYQSASANLETALSDTQWTALYEQENKNYYSLSPAIILDVDETVLDNSAFQARMIKQKSDFDLEKWNNWVMEAKADPVPGALSFIEKAKEIGIEIFYVTNREASVEEGTRKNLHKHGFPIDSTGNKILSKNEQENWTSAKKERRNFIAENYRVLMLLGDDLNDFVNAKGITSQKRRAMVKQHIKKWGVKWFIMPNPVYGSWEQSIYDFNERLTPLQIDSVKKAKLNTKTD